MKRTRIAIPIDTTELCSYGCNNVAKFINGSKNLMCCDRSTKCSEVKRKNSLGGKLVYSSNRRLPAKELYKIIPQESKDSMCWAKGLTKEVDERVARPKNKGKRFGASLTSHTEKTKQKLSKFRTEWLKDPNNRKNLGRGKKSWLEITFENYLNENKITGWETEKQFWNDDLNKNYFPDFIFESSKLIIELDGTQHRKTVLNDSIRDIWFNNLGYRVNLKSDIFLV